MFFLMRPFGLSQMNASFKHVVVDYLVAVVVVNDDTHRNAGNGSAQLLL